MNAQEKIIKAVNFTRTSWGLFMLCLTATYIFSDLPLWAGLFLIPLGFIVYAISCFLMGAYLATVITPEEIAEGEKLLRLMAIEDALNNGELEPGSDEMFEALAEAGEANLGAVTAFSPTLVGNYMDNPIHEWVEIHDPVTNKPERFAYFEPANLDKHKVPILPEDETKIFAVVNGIVYFRPVA